MKTSQFNLRIDPDLLEEVKVISKRKHNTVSGVICSLLEQYVEANEHLLP
jgi:hypothetical protein